jgi:hypothetical protein
MGDVKVGDLVIGSDGKPQKVLGVFPQGIRPIYKVEFSDKTSTFCDEEHIWAVNSINQRSNHSDKTYKPIITKNLINSIYIGNALNYRIPIIKPVEFNDKKLPINPYLLGLLIGDGSLSGKRVVITSIDIPIINKCKEIILNDYKTLNLKTKKNNPISHSFLGKSGLPNPLTREIKNLKLNITSDKKFIPFEYKYCSVKDRILLLQGLLDSDGSSSKDGKICYVTTSKTLSEDVRELVLSLGGFCRITDKKSTHNYKNEINPKLSRICI